MPLLFRSILPYLLNSSYILLFVCTYPFSCQVYTYYTVLYRKFSGLRRRYNTNCTINTNHTRGPLNETVSYRSISYSDPALFFMSFFDYFHSFLLYLTKFFYTPSHALKHGRVGPGRAKSDYLAFDPMQKISDLEISAIRQFGEFPKVGINTK